MLELAAADEATLVRRLVLELRAQDAVGHPPGLPAYLIFMCIRHR